MELHIIGEFITESVSKLDVGQTSAPIKGIFSEFGESTIVREMDLGQCTPQRLYSRSLRVKAGNGPFSAIMNSRSGGDGIRIC